MACSHNSHEEDAPGPGVPITVTSWSTEVTRSDVAEQTESSSHLKAGTIEATTDTGSCSIYDGGDKAQLKATGRPTKEQLHQEPHPSPAVENLSVSHAGDRFQESFDSAKHSATLDIDTPNDRGGEEQSGVTDFADCVRKSFHHDESTKRFLPYDKLDQLVTRDRVCSELRRHLSCPDSQIEAYADQIWGTSSLTVTRGDPFRETSRNHTYHTTMRRLFAILAFMDLLPLIVHFLESKIYDRHLPFTFNDNDERGRSATYTLEDATGSTMLFKDWRPSHVDHFKTLQWQFLSPFFSFNRRPPHYVLLDPVPLPFNYEGDEPTEGGYGEVRKITIHRSHYYDYKSKARAPHGSHTDSPPLALKKLLRKSNGGNDFKRERENHQNIPQHPNLIRLLASFERGGDYYLIFPWADGNLLDFWKAHRAPGQSEEHPEPMWFSQQCFSLAEGLNAIHNPGSLSADGQVLLGSKAHGRHGDLKPHNILWFKEEEKGKSSLGSFKYCDFGLSAFHRTASMQENPSGFGCSLTYMAPERDTGYNIGPCYDIFSFGCILLEFVIWYLDGWETVKVFSDVRVNEDKGSASDWDMDSFFQCTPIYTHSGDQRVPKASLKLSVRKEFDRLRTHPRCVDYLVDLLDLIETKMIRMTPGKRATAKSLVSELSSLDQRCRLDRNYATKKTKVCPPRASTYLSSLVGASSMDRPTRSNGDYATGNGELQVLTDEPVCKDGMAHEQESQAKEGSKPAALREESTLVETGGPRTDTPNDEQPRENYFVQAPLEHRVVTCQGVSSRFEHMTAANGREPDPEREPLLRRPSQDDELLTAPRSMWQTFCGFTFC